MSDYRQQQELEEEAQYQEWLYEMAVIDEINKELNCEKYIPSISESPESFCPSFKDQREPIFQEQIR
jgi:hypothetical protein